jgi:hypothetical protein
MERGPAGRVGRESVIPRGPQRERCTRGEKREGGRFAGIVAASAATFWLAPRVSAGLGRIAIRAAAAAPSDASRVSAMRRGGRLWRR